VLNPRLRGSPWLVVAAAWLRRATKQILRRAHGYEFREALRVCPKAHRRAGAVRRHYADLPSACGGFWKTYTPAVETAALMIFTWTLQGRSGCIRIFRERCGAAEEIFEAYGLERFGWSGAHESGGAIASRLEAPARVSHRGARRRGTFLTPLPVEKLYGLATCTRNAGRTRVTTIGQLREVPNWRCRRLRRGHWRAGVGAGARLDGREVLLPSTPKSVSRETTIEGGND